MVCTGLLILRATGFRVYLLLAAVALFVAVVYPNGGINHLGPLTFDPGLPVILVLPFLLGVGISLAHDSWPSPVVRRGLRTAAARGVSYAVAWTASVVVIGVGAELSEQVTFSALLRNLLLLSGMSALVGSLLGLVYAWLPATLALGISVLVSPSTGTESVYGLALQPSATHLQLIAALGVCMGCFTVAVADPRSAGYLRSR